MTILDTIVREDSVVGEWFAAKTSLKETSAFSRKKTIAPKIRL